MAAPWARPSFSTYLFHDVYLTAAGPAVVGHAVACWHHPEGGPGAFAFGEFDAGFKIAVLPAGAGVSVQTAGIDLVILLEAVYAQGSVLDLGHGSAGRGKVVYIVLEFVIDHTLTHDHVGPLCGIGLGAIVEFILPYKFVTFGCITLDAFPLN